MSQTNCPRCGDLLRFPAELPGEAIVRCPLCTEQFAFSEMEANLPPMVEIVSLPESVDEALDRIDDLLTLKPSTSATAAAPLVTTSAGSRSMARRRPPESPWRPLILLVEIALSGVVGIALAVLVLWWLPGQWHRDPLVLKPYAVKYAPWLLPPAHRPMSNLAADDEEPTPKLTKQGAAKPSSTGDRKIEWSTPVRPLPEEKKSAAVGDDSALNDSPNSLQEPIRKRSDSGNRTPTEPEKEWSFEEELKKLAEEEPEPPELNWTSSPEISGLLRTLGSLQAETAKSEESKAEYVKSFRELARVAGQVNADDVGLENARTRLDAWLANISDVDWRAACEATAAARTKPSIAPRGVVYRGKLTSALADGSWLRLELEPVPGDSSFPVLIAPALFHASQGDSLSGKEIYVLASELPDPKRLIADVPLGTKTAWVIGAIVNVEEAKLSEKATF
jgi:hypothetical protein